MRRILIAILGIVALGVGATVASADRGRGHDDHGHHHGGAPRSACSRCTPDPAGNPEGIAFDERSRAFFVGITNGGAIYRGTLGSDTVAPYIEGATGKAAIGLKVRRGKLYVAGGPTGAITVYDLATKAAVATFQTGTGGFLNDLVVTRRGDVYVTDSFRPTLWHVTAEQVRAGSGTPQALDVGAIPYEAGEFNLNGIVAKGTRKLVVVNTNSGKLFRITLGRPTARRSARSTRSRARRSPAATACCSTAAASSSSRATRAQLSFLKLRDSARRATLERTQTSDKLRGPSTVDRAKELYLVVNADFAPSRKPFTWPACRAHGHDADAETPPPPHGDGGAPAGYSYCSASSTFSREARRAGMTAAPTPASTAISVKTNSVLSGSASGRCHLAITSRRAPCRRRARARRRSAP